MATWHIILISVKTLRIANARVPTRPSKSYTINCEELLLVSEAKDLGITVDSHLKFDKTYSKNIAYSSSENCINSTLF